MKTIVLHSNLPHKFAIPIMLRFIVWALFEEKSLRQIARELGVARNTVHKVRDALRG